LGSTARFPLIRDYLGKVKSRKGNTLQQSQTFRPIKSGTFLSEIKSGQKHNPLITFQIKLFFTIMLYSHLLHNIEPRKEFTEMVPLLDIQRK